MRATVAVVLAYTAVASLWTSADFLLDCEGDNVLVTVTLLRTWAVGLVLLSAAALEENAVLRRLKEETE